LRKQKKFHCKRLLNGDVSFSKGVLSKKIYDGESFTLADKHPSCSTVKNRVAEFRTEHLSIEDECSGDHLK
jgi:hypothetical protein